MCYFQLCIELYFKCAKVDGIVIIPFSKWLVSYTNMYHVPSRYIYNLTQAKTKLCDTTTTLLLMIWLQFLHIYTPFGLFTIIVHSK